MAKENKTQYAILGMLNQMYGSGSGYDIKKACDTSIAYFWNENYGHIYPVLKQMEQEELITKQVEQTEGRPNKNVYTITDKGIDHLNKWLTTPVEYTPVRSELLLKTYFSKEIPVKTIMERFQKIKVENEKELLEYSNVEDLIKSMNEQVDRKSSALWIITLNSGKHNAEGIIKWCDETLKILEEIKDL